MYKITEIVKQDLNYLELASSNYNSKAIICINQGGRLSNFTFENIQILEDYNSTSYQKNYASAILFPFANRIKDGEYVFNDIKYNLKCNEVDKNNALHGLVYNKEFIITRKKTTTNHASVSLKHTHIGKSKGFPFKFSIELTYILNKNGFSLSTKIINEDENTFPFTLGWHPYFKTSNLNNSYINFKSNTKYLFDKQQTISGSTKLDLGMPFNLKGVKLDNGYPLETNTIHFSTPEYNFKLTSTSKENYLQLYTPNQPNVIAIEPMTGAADSFNNKIGLQMLNPNGTYIVEWHLDIKTSNQKK